MNQAKAEQDLGEHVIHKYDIFNKGPAPIEEAFFYILWSYQSKEGDDLMYLLNQPEVSGNMKCDHTYYANPEGLRLDPMLQNKRYLGDHVQGKGSYESSSSSSRSDGSYSGSSFTSSSSSSSGEGSSTHFSSSGTNGSSVSSVAGGGGSISNFNTITEEEKRRRLDKEENIQSVGEHSEFDSRGAGGSGSFHYKYSESGVGSDGKAWESSTEYHGLLDSSGRVPGGIQGSHSVGNPQHGQRK